MKRMSLLNIPQDQKELIARIKSWKDKLEQIAVLSNPSDGDNMEKKLIGDSIVDSMLKLDEKYHKYIDMTITSINETQY